MLLYPKGESLLMGCLLTKGLYEGKRVDIACVLFGRIHGRLLNSFPCFFGRVVAQEDIAYEYRAGTLSCETDLTVHSLAATVGLWVSGLGSQYRVSRIAFWISDDAIHGLSSRGLPRR